MYQELGTEASISIYYFIQGNKIPYIHYLPLLYLPKSVPFCNSFII